MSARRVFTRRSVGHGLFVLVCAISLAAGVVWQRSQATNMISDYHEDGRFVAVSQAPTPITQTEAMRKRHDIQVSDAVPDTGPLPPEPLVPVYLRVPTAHRVVFVTIDDGVAQNTDAARYIVEHRLPYTAFLTISVAHHNFAYFQWLQQAGVGVQNHTVNHPSLPRLPYDQQKLELCSTSDTLQRVYGRRPTLFRPPYGEYNQDTRRAATDCGMKALVLWSAVVNNGTLLLQPPHTQLEPGDIVLLHFRPELGKDIETVMQAAHAQNLAVARLEDYLR